MFKSKVRGNGELHNWYRWYLSEGQPIARFTYSHNTVISLVSKFLGLHDYQCGQILKDDRPFLEHRFCAIALTLNSSESRTLKGNFASDRIISKLQRADANTNAHYDYRIRGRKQSGSW